MDYKWSWTLIAASLMLLIGSATGCITVVREGAPTSAPQEPAVPPVINSFAASPANISQGQQTTLSWNVSGAKTITIQPDIGSVGPSGSLQLSPPATITYTLTAANQAGSSTTGSVNIAVTPAPTGKPDLVITDIHLEGTTVYYKIKNQGNADAGLSQSRLYVDNLERTTNQVEPLAAGEERSTSFSNWSWPFQFPLAGSATSEPGTLLQYALKVCADLENSVGEIDEGNNCTTVILGQTFTYDFVLQAPMAEWRSGATILRWPMFPGNQQGAAYLQSWQPNTLTMCPEQVSNGWIRGKFADYYYDTKTLTTRSRLLEIPDNAKFTAKVGFGPGTTSADGVRVAFGYVDATGSVVLLQKMDVYSDGTLRSYEVDLSDIAGKKTEFILWVEAKDSPEGDCVRWVQPKIVQE
jgi:hypothetical protein